MPPFCSHRVARFVSTKGAFCLPTHIVWLAITELQGKGCTNFVIVPIESHGKAFEFRQPTGFCGLDPAG